jgi:hypothetical protein
MNNPNEAVEKKPEQSREESAIERRESVGELKEERYEDKIAGAEILEDPKDGSFLHGLQAFVAWVNALLGKKD